MVQYVVCSSFFRKATGLMFRFPKGPFVYYFPFSSPRKIAITMWFVFFPIDVVFVDKKGVIVEKVSLRPFTFYRSSVQAFGFYEVPLGASDHLAVGMKISWKSFFE